MSDRPLISRRQLLIATATGAVAAACTRATPAAPSPTPEAPATQAPATEAPEPAATEVPVEAVPPDVSNTNLEQIKRLADPKANLKGFHGPIISSVETITTFNDQMFDKKMEELTNVHVGWQAAADWGRQPLEMLMASGDIPDLIAGWYAINSDYADFGQKGALAPLNDLIDSNQYLSMLLKDRPDVRAQLVAPDGNIYAYPAITDGMRQCEFGYYIRQDWLEEVGMPVPSTVDEWYGAMKAFRGKDPNRHPLAWLVEMTIWLWGVGYNYSTYGTNFYHAGKEVRLGPIQPEFRAALAFLNKLYKEEIIPQDYLKIAQEGMGAERVMSAGIAGSGVCLNNHIEYVVKNDPKAKFAGMQPPLGPTGNRELLANWFGLVYWTGTCIGARSKQKELAAQYTDLYYSDSGNALYFWGVLGDTYIEENGVRKFTDKVLKDPKMSSFEYQWTVISPTWLGGYWNKSDDWVALMAPETKKAVEEWSAKPWQSIQLPALYWTEDEREIVNSVEPDLNTLVAENVAKFIDGTSNLEADYQAWQDQIKSLNVAGLTSVYQASYDRFLAA